MSIRVKHNDEWIEVGGSGDMYQSVYDPSGGAKQVAFADELPIPDWNENDPTSPNYVANRTHYVDTVNDSATANSRYVEQFSEQVYLAMSSQVRINSLPIANSLANIFVNVDGVETEYSNQLLDYHSYGEGQFISNISMEEFVAQAQTGVITSPVLVGFFESEFEEGGDLIPSYSFYYLSNTAFSNVTITTNYVSGTYHKLDNRFLTEATPYTKGIIEDCPNEEDEYYTLYARTVSGWSSFKIPENMSDLYNDKDYIRGSDYPTKNYAGVIRTNETYGTMVENEGTLKAKVLTAEEYESFDNKGFISKGTLDAVLSSTLGDIETALASL